MKRKIFWSFLILLGGLNQGSSSSTPEMKESMEDSLKSVARAFHPELTTLPTQEEILTRMQDSRSQFPAHLETALREQIQNDPWELWVNPLEQFRNPNLEGIPIPPEKLNRCKGQFLDSRRVRQISLSQVEIHYEINGIPRSISYFHQKDTFPFELLNSFFPKYLLLKINNEFLLSFLRLSLEKDYLYYDFSSRLRQKIYEIGGIFLRKKLKKFLQPRYPDLEDLQDKRLEEFLDEGLKYVRREPHSLSKKEEELIDNLNQRISEKIKKLEERTEKFLKEDFSLKSKLFKARSVFFEKDENLFGLEGISLFWIVEKRRQSHIKPSFPTLAQRNEPCSDSHSSTSRNKKKRNKKRTRVAVEASSQSSLQKGPSTSAEVREEKAETPNPFSEEKIQLGRTSQGKLMIAVQGRTEGLPGELLTPSKQALKKDKSPAHYPRLVVLNPKENLCSSSGKKEAVRDIRVSEKEVSPLIQDRPTYHALGAQAVRGPSPRLLKEENGQEKEIERLREALESLNKEKQGLEKILGDQTFALQTLSQKNKDLTEENQRLNQTATHVVEGWIRAHNFGVDMFRDMEEIARQEGEEFWKKRNEDIQKDQIQLNNPEKMD